MKTILLSATALALFAALLGGCIAQEDDSTLLEEPSMDGQAAFPEGEAGLAAYIKTGQAIDLDKLKAIFFPVREVGDNYILGTVPISDWGGNIDINLYADTDGWIVAYLKREDPVSMVMQWGDSDPDNPTIGIIRSTTLEDALYKAGEAAGVGIVSNDIDYYHFGYPNANNMMIIVKVQPTSGVGIHQIEIPTNFILFDSAYYYYEYCFGYCTQYCGSTRDYWAMTNSNLKIDGTDLSNAAPSNPGWGGFSWWRGMDRYKSAMAPGMLHTIEISHSGSDTGSSGVATVLIYRAYK